MDADTDSSFISGQPKILDKLEEDEIMKISKLFSQINDNALDKKIFDEDEFESIKEWGKEEFKEIIDRIKNNLFNVTAEEIPLNDELNNNNEIKISKKSLVEKNLKIIQNIIMPANRFKSVTSTVIKALKNGERVLIDNIQFASSQIIELISCLYGKNPFLDLIEKGEDFYFSSEENAKNKIHKDFRIFITVAPSYSINSNLIDQTLRQKMY